MLDAKIASSLNKVIPNSQFRKKVNFEEQKAQEEDQFLRGRQIAFMIYDYFRVTGAHDTVLDYADLFSVTLLMTTFRNSIWHGTKSYYLLCQRFHPMKSWKVCTNCGYVSLEPLKNVLEVYDMEIHQKWPLFQWYVYPRSSQSFPNDSTAGVSWRSTTVTNKSNSLTYTAAFSLVCTSPLAVITVIGLLDALMVSNSAELRSPLLTICSRIHYKLSFLRLFCWPSREYPFFCRREECSRVVRFDLVCVFGKFPSLALGTSLLSFSLFVGPVLDFYSVVTSLMSRCDLYFSKRWSFIFPDTRVT